MHYRLTLLLLAVAVASAAAEDPLPDVWQLPAAHLRDNGQRGEVVLNAFWERRADGSGTPELVRVPHVYGRAGTNEYSRVFDLPAGWERRRLVIETGGFTADGVVSFQGSEVGRVRSGSPWTDVPLPPTQAGRQRVAIRTGLIHGDTWLRSYPANGFAIEDTYLTTSVRRGEVAVELSGSAPPGSVIEPVVHIWVDLAATQVVKELVPPTAIGADASGRWRTRIIAPWPDAELWSQWNPRLYSYGAEVRAGGKVVDAQLPRSFGFREVWKNGNQVMLNGVPLHFTGDTWSGIVTRDGNLMPQQAAAILPRLKAAGITAGHRLENDAALEACARFGMLTMAYVGGLDIPVDQPGLLAEGEAGDAGGDADLRALQVPKLEASRTNIVRRIQRWRENPAIMSWSVRAPWNRSTLNSLMQGNVEDPWNYWPGNKEPEKNRTRYEIAERSIAFVRDVDPYRLVGAQNSPGADVEWSTRYLCSNLDPQERAAFFDRWTTNRAARAVWPSEYQETFNGHHFIRKGALQIPQNDRWPTIHVENAAREFGPGVYLDPTDDELRQWTTAWGTVHAASPVYQRLVADTVWQVFRGWRTAGVSGFAHWQMREGYRGSTKLKKVEDRLGIPREVDPRQPGFSQAVGDSDKPTSFPIPGVDDRLVGGAAYEHAIAPLLIYLGGGGGNYNSRDHLYFQNAPVRKSVVVLNDTDRAVSLRGGWQLVESDGRMAMGGTLTARIAPGEHTTDRLPIAFAAPAVAVRSDFQLRVALTNDSSAELTDVFGITVFPSRAASALPKTRHVWTVGAMSDPTDRVSAMLRDVHAAKPVSATSASPVSGDLLVVLRHGLENPTELAHLSRIGLDTLVARGLRVLVLEQTGTNVFGLATENVRPRRVFMAAPGHPVLAGLGESDLTYWSGASDLEPGAEPIDERTRMVFPSRIWHVNGENAVATRTLIRPQVGACRALVVSGFDLAETPLLEVARGSGRMVFCQLDVSNRYGTDPVATRIVDNVLEYLATSTVPDPQRDTVGRLLVDGQTVVLRPDTFRATKPEGAAGWGITEAELFFRESIYTGNWVTKKRPAGEIPVLTGTPDDGRPQVLRSEPPAGRFALTLDESLFTTGWARRKVAFVRSALVVNQGGSRLDGPALCHQGDATVLYPHRWLEGFVNPYTAACW